MNNRLNTIVAIIKMSVEFDLKQISYKRDNNGISIRTDEKQLFLMTSIVTKLSAFNMYFCIEDEYITLRVY